MLTAAHASLRPVCLFEGHALTSSWGTNEAVAQLVDRPSTLEWYELRGCMQMLPRIARHFESADLDSDRWHEKVAGDSHTMLRWVSPTHAQVSNATVCQMIRHLIVQDYVSDEYVSVLSSYHDAIGQHAQDGLSSYHDAIGQHAQDGLSIVGLGRSADASCYYLPEWGVVLDAGIATKAFTPKSILLSERRQASNSRPLHNISLKLA